MEHIYLDYNASAPMAPGVVAAMEPFLHHAFGNPSSQHWAGRPAREGVDKARAEVASLLACRPEEVIFTSGGTESNNFAIKGVFHRVLASGAASPHFVTCAVEHPSVRRAIDFLVQRLGARITVVPVDTQGRVDPKSIESALTKDTVLVTVMHANNEVGTLQPIAEISRICRARSILFHTDAAQSAGKIPVLVDELGVDLLTVAGHKLRAPKGVGALYIRSGVQIEPLLHGAGHERGLRSGTENVLLEVGLGAACRIAREQVSREHGGAPTRHTTEIERLRNRLEDGIVGLLGSQVRVNGPREGRLPNTLSINFVGRVGREVLDALGGVAASTGAACHSGVVELSAVLRAMGVPEEVGMGAVRFSLGFETSEQEIDAVLGKVKATLAG